jgi:hypothetical protein
LERNLEEIAILAFWKLYFNISSYISFEIVNNAKYKQNLKNIYHFILFFRFFLFEHLMVGIFL